MLLAVGAMRRQLLLVWSLIISCRTMNIMSISVLTTISILTLAIWKTRTPPRTWRESGPCCLSHYPEYRLRQVLLSKPHRIQLRFQRRMKKTKTNDQNLEFGVAKIMILIQKMTRTLINEPKTMLAPVPLLIMM